jgi:hypothetical protein
MGVLDVDSTHQKPDISLWEPDIKGLQRGELLEVGGEGSGPVGADAVSAAGTGARMH